MPAPRSDVASRTNSNVLIIAPNSRAIRARVALMRSAGIRIVHGHRLYPDWPPNPDALLAHVDAPVIAIAGCPALHRSLAEHVLGAARRLLIDLPLADDLVDGAAIVAAARIARQHAAVHAPARFRPVVRMAASLLRRNAIGAPESLWLMLTGDDREILPGCVGTLPDAHALDLIGVLLGNALTITCRTATDTGHLAQTGQRSTTVIELENDAVATILEERRDRSGAPRAELRMLGKRGVIEIGFSDPLATGSGAGDTLRWRRNTDQPGTWRTEEIPLPAVPVQAGPLLDLISLPKSRKPESAALEIGLNVTRMQHAARRSAASGQTIVLADVQP